jgi:AGCS family alanine or glycine:cation symporter
MLVKYCEIYLGITHRVRNMHGGYDGGPMYYLQAAFNNRILPVFVCVLICIYTADVSQFLIVTDTISQAFSLNHLLVTLSLLLLVFIIAKRGMRSVAFVSLFLMPPFLVSYVACCILVIAQHMDSLIALLPTIFYSAFEGHAPLGGFAGSSILMAAQYGTSRAVYSGDIGIGFDAIIQSESRVQYASKQARMAVFALANDMLICTLTCLVVLSTGLWLNGDLQPSEYIVTAFALHLPFAPWFMNALFVVTGFTSVVTFMAIGFKSARFLHPSWGESCFLFYAAFAFTLFSFCEQSQVILVMSSCSALLLICNMAGIMKLRKQIIFREA